MAATSKAWVCGLSFAGSLCSNHAGGMDVCPLRVLCCLVEVFCRADHSSRGVLPGVVCLSVIVKPRYR